MIRQTVLIMALLVSSFPAWSEVTEASCRNFSGQRLYTPECIELFKRIQPLSDIECFKTPSCRDQKEAEGEAKARQREAEHKAQLAAAAKAEAELQARCGNDLNNPRIGMKLARALECCEGLELIAQEKTARGVVLTYGDGSNFLRSRGGRVISLGTY